MTPPESIQVMIVDDQVLVREGFKRLIEIESGITVMALAEDGAAACQMMSALAQSGTMPDVILMDIRMPVMDGIAATARLQQDFPQVHVILLTTFDDADYVVRGMQAGARGYLLKDATLQSLIEAIRTAARGDLYFHAGVFAHLLEHLTLYDTPSGIAGSSPMKTDLTERERDVLGLIAQGASNREISERLFITEGTVKNHISNILSKLNLRDRTQAAIFARNHGLG